MGKLENSSPDSPEIFEFSRSSFTAKKVTPSIKYHERDGGGQGLDRHAASEIPTWPCSGTNNRFSWSFMQQRIPTGINQIFSWFMRR